uniref:Uncharacterized protein n=1 Tax=Ditylenchus dipsaci TaxID=166011 RepID=A0A915EKS2_9BILA
MLEDSRRLRGMSADDSDELFYRSCKSGWNLSRACRTCQCSRSLNLSDNKLTGGLEVLADKCPDLAYIILSGNSLKDIDVLKPLAKMDKLLDLELCNTWLG